MSAAAVAQAAADAVPARSGYASARLQWIAEGLVINGAIQNAPLDLAVADLRRGQHTDTRNTAGYPAAIATIEDLEKLPITDMTRRQIAD